MFTIPVPTDLEPSLGGLVLHEVGDPGNVGTLLRSATAFGLKQILCIGGASIWSPKVVQASSGVLPLVAIHQVADLSAVATGARQSPWSHGMVCDLPSSPCRGTCLDGGGQ